MKMSYVKYIIYTLLKICFIIYIFYSKLFCMYI